MANGEGGYVSPIEILLVEDSPADVRLTREALKEEKLHMNLHVVGDGVEAMQYLRKEGKYAKAVRPDLLLLDLNLPKKDGREVLQEIKSDDQLKTIPTVVLTVSKAEEDVLKTYNLHANCFITKPLDLNQFSRVVKSIKEFWLTIVKLPPNGDK
jgi:CheY-like chemotaxis protein